MWLQLNSKGLVMRCDQRVKLLNLQFSLSLGCLLLGAFYWVPTAQKKKTIGCLRPSQKKGKKKQDLTPKAKSQNEVTLLYFIGCLRHRQNEETKVNFLLNFTQI